MKNLLLREIESGSACADKSRFPISVPTTNAQRRKWWKWCAVAARSKGGQNKQNFGDEFFLVQPNTEAETELQGLELVKLHGQVYRYYCCCYWKNAWTSWT